MFQVYVAGIEPVERSLEAAGWPLYAGRREVWREVGDREAGQREIFVLDPDGYLIMVAHELGERQLSERRSRMTVPTTASRIPPLVTAAGERRDDVSLDEVERIAI
jgi:hypothetical protein